MKPGTKPGTKNNSPSRQLLRSLRWLTLFGVLLTTVGVLAEDPVNSSFFGGAIKGYDAVAYHSEGIAKSGSRKFSYDWNGATWRFASAHNRDLFAADPQKYAPQYGGYCAWAMADGQFVGVDPKLWTIVEGKLYLNYNRDVQKKWKKNIPAFIERADAQYQRLTAP